MQQTFQQLLSRISFRQLQVFQSVYEQQGYRKAADFLGLTQPAVSSQISKLEQALGQPLFEYVGRKIYCTRAGEHVAQRVQKMFEQVAYLQSDLHSLDGKLSGELSLGAVTTVQSIVPYLLKSFMDLHPAVNVKLRIVNRSQALTLLDNNTDDLLIMGMVPSDRALYSLPFLDNELIPVISAAHSFKQRKKLTPQQFLDANLLLREAGSGSRLALEQHCQQNRLTINPFIEMGSNEAIKHGVVDGMGVAVLPKLSILAELKIGSIKTVSIKGFPLRRSWCLVYPSGKHPSTVAQAFLDFVQQNIKDINQHFKTLAGE
jgi:DNA-binding transcriptional LysR family regulator